MKLSMRVKSEELNRFKSSVIYKSGCRVIYYYETYHEPLKEVHAENLSDFINFFNDEKIKYDGVEDLLKRFLNKNNKALGVAIYDINQNCIGKLIKDGVKKINDTVVYKEELIYDYNYVTVNDGFRIVYLYNDGTYKLGVGANVAYMLSRAGFENFILVDNDIVEHSNLIRQYPYQKRDLGRNKTEALASKLDGNIVIKKIMIDKKEQILKDIQKCDIVICTLDKPFRVIRRLINDICVSENKPVIFAGFAEHVAMIGPFVIPHETACLKCIDKETTDIPLENVKNIPSYGPLCALISSIVVNEIIKYFNNYTEYNLRGKTMMFNFATYDTQIINWNKKDTCEVCAKYDS